MLQSRWIRLWIFASAVWVVASCYYFWPAPMYLVRDAEVPDWQMECCLKSEKVILRCEAKDPDCPDGNPETMCHYNLSMAEMLNYGWPETAWYEGWGRFVWGPPLGLLILLIGGAWVRSGR